MLEDRDKTIQIEIGPVAGSENASLISLNGYIDSYNAQYFQNSVMNHIGEGNKNVIIEAGGLSYISSAGIGAFMAITRKLDDGDGNLILCSLTEKVMEVFNLLGFTSFFKIVESKENAVSEMQNTLTSGSEPSSTDKIVEKIIFPMIFECPSCRKRLKAPKPGKYRCTFCKNIISIDENGNVSAII